MSRYGFEYWDNRASKPVPDIETVGVVGSQFCDHLPQHIELMINPGETLLDAGCGYGRFSVPLALKGLHVVGVDASVNMLRRFRLHIACLSLANVDLVRSSLTHLPFRDGCFGTAFCIGTLYYVDKTLWKKILSEFERVSRESSIELRNALSPYNVRRKIAFLLVKLLGLTRLLEFPDEHIALPGKLTLRPKFFRTVGVRART